MYIRQVWIENIRGFRGGDGQRVHLNLERAEGEFAGWTVIAGRNGVGKSSLLKAIALAVVGPAAARSLQESFVGWVRMGESSGYLAVELELGDGDRFTGAKGNIKRGPFWADLVLESQAGGPEPTLKPKPNTANDRLKSAERGPWAENPAGWFLAGYGPFRRLSGHAADAMRLMSGPNRLARVVSLFREDASLVECVEWLRNIYLRKLEGKPGADQLEAAVIALLNHGLLPDEMHIDHVDSEGLWTERDGVHLPLRDLSDGYRTVTALVLDLVKQLHGSFGDFDVIADGEALHVTYPGVVLIDEPEVHLHVSWQKRIGFWLKEHFPNIQFIVTTHSPFICQAADPNGLFRLAAPSDPGPTGPVSEDVYHTVINGSADDAVMTELFGHEPPYSHAAEQLREDVGELEARVIEGKATKDDKATLKALKAQLPKTLSAEVEKALGKLSAEISKKTGTKR